MKILTLTFILVFGLSVFGQPDGYTLKTIIAQKGDTIETIAKRYNVAPVDIARQNKLLPNIILKEGKEILIFSISEAVIKKIATDAGGYFKQGLLDIKENRRSQAVKNFNLSLEVFLLAGINVQANQRLRECYSQISETTYRIEFPSVKQQPNIRSLSAICGWNVENNLADEIAKFVLTNQNNGNQSNANQGGFNEQKFESSPLDDLAKLDLAENIPDAGSLKYGFKVVKAQSGDTVAIVAQRYGKSPAEVAKFNELLVTTVLPYGRELMLPNDSLKKVSANNDTFLLGDEPSQDKDGKVRIVMNYFNENFNDPYSMRFVKWSNIVKVYVGSKPYWGVQVRFRAKNGFNAYVLSEMIFYIQRNKIITTKQIF